MKSNWKELATSVIASLSEKEREDSIVYLEQRIVPPGEELSWTGITRSFDEPVVVAFVDLQPALNWTHNARYILLDPEGKIRETITVDRPPFLTGVSPDLCVIHRGAKAPEWATATVKQIENNTQ